MFHFPRLFKNLILGFPPYCFFFNNSAFGLLYMFVCTNRLQLWHISDITCPIFMSTCRMFMFTCQLLMSTCQKNITTTSSLISYFYILLMPLTVICLSVWYMTSRHHYLTSHDKSILLLKSRLFRQLWQYVRFLCCLVRYYVDR